MPDNKLKAGFSPIWRVDFLDLKEMSITAFVLRQIYRTFKDHKTNTVNLSEYQISNLTGLNRKTIRKAKKQLVELGEIIQVGHHKYAVKNGVKNTLSPEIQQGNSYPSNGVKNTPQQGNSYPITGYSLPQHIYIDKDIDIIDGQELFPNGEKVIRCKSCNKFNTEDCLMKKFAFRMVNENNIANGCENFKPLETQVKNGVT